MAPKPSHMLESLESFGNTLMVRAHPAQLKQKAVGIQRLRITGREKAREHSEKRVNEETQAIGK